MGMRFATTASRSACLRSEDHVDFAGDSCAIGFCCFCLVYSSKTHRQGEPNDGSEIDVRGKYRKVLPASHGITQQPASQGSGSHRKLLLRVLPNGLEDRQPSRQPATAQRSSQPVMVAYRIAHYCYGCYLVAQRCYLLSQGFRKSNDG